MKTMGFSILVLGIISLLDKRSYDKIKLTGMQDVQLKPPGVSFAFIYFGGQHCKHVIHVLHKQLFNGHCAHTTKSNEQKIQKRWLQKDF